MRKLVLGLALASTAIATPALARDNSWYLELDFGGMIVEDADLDVNGINNAATVDFKKGFDGGGIIGYDFGPFRLETEASYRQAKIKNSGGADASNLSFMVNGLLDFGPDDGLQGFVGGGVGVARVKGKYGLNTYGNFVNDSDTVFAWQAIAGIRAPITSHIDASLKYRFFNAENVKLVDVTGRTLDGRFRTHSILGGFTYNFGEPAAPPPPPPPPPAVVCSPGPFIVFFEWDKSDITPEAASILDNAISQYANCGNAQVMLAGHADRSGSAKYNVGLSQRRADAVKAYMVAHSVPDGVISEQAFGESRPRVETADGVREVQNRRVEITYGPSSGQ